MITKNMRSPVSVLMIFLLIQIQISAILGEVHAADVPGNSAETIPQPVVPFALTTQQSLNNSKPFTPGDGIWVNTYPDTSSFLNRPFPIDNNGMIEFPMIGRVRVTDMSVSQLEEFLKTQFKSYLRLPYLLVKPMIRISVLGGVQRPGLFYVDHEQSLWEVMYYVGGTVNEDGLKDMHLERDNDVVYDNLIPFYEKGVSLKNMGVESGDQIWVPSPDREDLWAQIKEIMPLLTFATGLFFFYLSYQQQVRAAQTR